VAKFDEMYAQYFKDVYRYVFSLCRNETIAEDVTQETFIKAFEGIDNFNGNCKIRVWLCQIAKNMYFSYHRKNKKYVEYSDDLKLTETDNFELKFLDNEMASKIHKVLHLLEEPYKEVFTLRLFGELSFSQIADLFGKTESWARVTYYRAKLKLKEAVS